MKKQTKYAFLIAFLVVLVTVFYWIPKYEKETSVNNIEVQEEYKVAPITQPSEDLEEVVKQGYMEGCLEGGAVTYEYCNCTYNYLRDKHGLKNLVNMSMELDTDNPEDYPQWLWDAVENCI